MKLLVATVSRSDFGILSTLIILLKNYKKFDVRTLVTGEHFSNKMGKTFNEIHNKKIKINKKIKLKEFSSEPISVLKKSSEIFLRTGFSIYFNKTIGSLADEKIPILPRTMIFENGEMVVTEQNPSKPLGRRKVPGAPAPIHDRKPFNFLGKIKKTWFLADLK